MMMTNRFSRIAVTLGLTLAACSNPPVEASDDTGSETGDGDGDAEAEGDGDGDDEAEGDGDGDGDPGDGDGEGDGDGDGEGDGDGDGEGDGDGDGDPAECGNGAVEVDEACDDGNDVDDDECTNACALPVCGDGIIQAGNGEACDDGNLDAGDGCTASCVIPGALIWEVVIDIGAQMEDDAGYEVVIDSGDGIGVLYRTGGAYRIAEYDADGNPVWDFASINTDKPNLVIGPSDELALGGKTNGNQGMARVYDTQGNLLWSQNIAAANSSVLGVGVDGAGNIIAAGFHANNDALLLRYDNMGNVDWSHFEMDGVALGPVAVNSDGQIWNVRAMPRQVETYAPDGAAGWVSAMLENEGFEDLVADPDGNVYLLSVALDVQLLSVSKYDSNGMLQWNVDHDDPNVLEIAGGLAVLPSGGVLVSGATNGAPSEADGLLAWYDGDGNPLIPDVVIDGPDDTDFDVLYDVALDTAGGYGVAVGAREPAGGTSDLWIRKFEI
jgi:cysteine-rich repeat protein